jgi:hypothetical protein
MTSLLWRAAILLLQTFHPMAADHPEPVYVKSLKITRGQTDTKDILFMDDDGPVYGIGMAEEREIGSSLRLPWKGLLPKMMDRDVGQVCHYDQSSGKVVLGEVCRPYFIIPRPNYREHESVCQP